MITEKTIVFDMDGTIANFYGVNDWLDYLHNYNPTPYIVAEPLVNMALLNSLLMALKNQGWKVAIVSWLSKDSNKEFDNEVREAKREWLKRYDFPFDEIHLVKYGTTKANCTRKNGGFQVLVDDNEKVRKGWNLGATIDANKDIIAEIVKLVLNEYNIIAEG
jgi:phosphoglycolate phosphatase-like HAD superfamily hydrolase